MFWAEVIDLLFSIIVMSLLDQGFRIKENN